MTKVVVYQEIYQKLTAFMLNLVLCQNPNLQKKQYRTINNTKV